MWLQPKNMVDGNNWQTCVGWRPYSVKVKATAWKSTRLVPLWEKPEKRKRWQTVNTCYWKRERRPQVVVKQSHFSGTFYFILYPIYLFLEFVSLLTTAGSLRFHPCNQLSHPANFQFLAWTSWKRQCWDKGCTKSQEKERKKNGTKGFSRWTTPVCFSFAPLDSTPFVFPKTLQGIFTTWISIRPRNCFLWALPLRSVSQGLASCLRVKEGWLP